MLGRGICVTRSLRYTSGAIPPNLLPGKHGSGAISSTYLWGIGGTRNRELACCRSQCEIRQTLYRLSYPSSTTTYSVRSGRHSTDWAIPAQPPLTAIPVRLSHQTFAFVFAFAWCERTLRLLSVSFARNLGGREIELFICKFNLKQKLFDTCKNYSQLTINRCAVFVPNMYTRIQDAFFIRNSLYCKPLADVNGMENSECSLSANWTIISGQSRISPRWGRGHQCTILSNFPKKWMKLKEFGWGRVTRAPPP